MGLAMVRSRALVGMQAFAVTVEVHLANGLPSFTLVGLADVEVREARERVRSAIVNSGLPFPANQRITVNLAPADLPKDSGRFDLPIALGILAASGQLDPQRLAAFEFAGELSLSGALRSVRGALAMSLAANLAAQGSDSGSGAGEASPSTPDHPHAPVRLVLPRESALEAALAPQVQVFAASSLLEVAQRFLPISKPIAQHARATSARATGSPVEQSESDATATAWLPVEAPRLGTSMLQPLCLSDVKGQATPKRALEIAAAGGHSLLLVGPPGTGKSMLAQRLSGLLPPMTPAEALEYAAMASLRGRLDLARFGQRPTVSPHHSASAVALVGGGSPPQPGEVSLAHHGVLFLDEMPEFPRSALEALREPLENGHITIARASRRAEFPARFQLVGAMNPCPCGYLGQIRPACRCSPEQILRYHARLSGPLLDRIDLQVEVSAVPPEELLQTAGQSLPEPNSAAIATRCAAARQLALARQGKANAALSASDLIGLVPLDGQSSHFLAQAAQRLAWSARATHRCLRVARTIADLAGAQEVGIAQLAEAMHYRPVLKSP